MRRISAIITNSGIMTLEANQKLYSVQPDHPNYDKIKKAYIDDNAAVLESLINVATSVQKYMRGKVKVENGQVFYNNEVVHDVITQRILKFMGEGLPHQPLLLFFENRMSNPSTRCREQLYPFLENEGLPITDDGCFLAYKRVRDNWTDFHTGKKLYTVGSVVTEERYVVDDDPSHGCSRGLHVGALKYVEGFNSGGHVIICKVNPKDVVSVPQDCSFQKVRCCELKVVGEYQGLLAQSLYTTSDKSYDSWDDDEWDDDDNFDYEEWDDEDDSELEEDEDDDDLDEVCDIDSLVDDDEE